MRQKQHDPLHGGSGSASVDSRGQRLQSGLPLLPSTVLKQAATQRLRRMRLVERVHRLGPRVMYELLDEFDRHYGIGADLDRRLERYAGLDARVLRAVGGDCFPRLPIRVVGAVEP
jgi:hypothetical protein